MRTKTSAKSRTSSRLAPIVQPSPGQISQRAKALWESYGRPVGRDEEIWLEAERQLREIPDSDATAAGAVDDSLLGDETDNMERAIEKIQKLGETPRGTQQVIR